MKVGILGSGRWRRRWAPASSSLVRTEATGYGCIYFCENMLNHRGDSVEGKSVAISGSGNVAIYAAEKAVQMGAKAVTLSDSDGFVHDPDGIDEA